MKITHICLSGPFNEGWNYQENALSLYHKKLGFDVSIITSPFTNDKYSTGYLYSEVGEKVDSNGIKIIRLSLFLKLKFKIIKKLRIYDGLLHALQGENPSIIFIHGLQFFDILKIAKYVKNRKQQLTIYVDGHEDFNNSGRNWFSKKIIHGLLWKYCAKVIGPYTKTFWGVTPGRVEFLINMYHLQNAKVKLLLMGAEDDKCNLQFTNQEIDNIKNKYCISKEDFILVTGGKIDKNKSQILLLMDAVKEFHRIKLIIFGSISNELNGIFQQKLNRNTCFVGWQDSVNIYKYFNYADLVIFPGLHSVLWEQAVGQGKPCVFKYIDGFQHIDLGGNCKFVYRDSVEEINQVIRSVVLDRSEFEKMKEVAQGHGRVDFLYSAIAKKSIDWS